MRNAPPYRDETLSTWPVPAAHAVRRAVMRLALAASRAAALVSRRAVAVSPAVRAESAARRRLSARASWRRTIESSRARWAAADVSRGGGGGPSELIEIRARATVSLGASPMSLGAGIA